jgi:predicted metal-dependent peptidase
MLKPDELPELDYRRLDRELDRVKTQVFLGKSAAFFGSLMCSLNFEWDKSLPTAGTNGTFIKWNPYYFHFLSKEGRKSILMHELRHVAYLHPLRRGTRDPEIWNYAVDTVLDNEMDHEGYPVSGEAVFPRELFGETTHTFVNHDWDGLSAEEIYDKMIADAIQVPLGYRPDLIDEGINPHAMINGVVSATHAAKLAGAQAGDIPGDVETTLRRFLKPKLPWKQLHAQFFTQLTEQDYSWRRPSRRSTSMYLPSMFEDEGGLEHIVYFEDVSGSVTDDEVVRFNSEVKYVWDTFKPLKMSLVQFDTRITKETHYDRDDPFEEVVIVGRGGTSLVPVRDYIIEHKPTAVVIFSDLQCNAMEKLPSDLNVPILWVAINNSGAQVNQGKLIHIRE